MDQLGFLKQIQTAPLPIQVESGVLRQKHSCLYGSSSMYFCVWSKELTVKKSGVSILKHHKKSSFLQYVQSCALHASKGQDPWLLFSDHASIFGMTIESSHGVGFNGRIKTHVVERYIREMPTISWLNSTFWCHKKSSASADCIFVTNSDCLNFFLKLFRSKWYYLH